MQGPLLRHSPKAPSRPFQLSMPIRICPIDNSKNIFTEQLLQRCREGSGAGRAVLTPVLAPSPALALPSTGMVKNAFGAEPGPLQGLELPLLHGKDGYWHPNISIYGQGCTAVFLHQPWMELMFPKGSPVLAVEQGWTPFFCNYCLPWGD